jgi:hypothetical protein
MDRLAVFVWAVAVALAPVSAVAGAERQCADGRCVELAWPDRSPDLRSPTAIQALVAAGGLAADEADAAAALAERRLALRIRGLELRYLVGKTATSTSDTAALDPIRYQIDAIDQEIAFIDRELEIVLDSYSRRKGPWLMRLEEAEQAWLWFVAPPPCGTGADLALAGDGNWLPVGAQPDPAAPRAMPPGACVPWRLDIGETAWWRGSPTLRLKSGGEAWSFTFAE